MASIYDNIINNIYTNTIVFCDIDDTIIIFDNITKKWWIDKFEIYYNKTKSYDEADSLSLEEWNKYIANNVPKLIDSKGFYRLISKIKDTDSTLIFITSRNKSLEELTKKHFTSIGFYDIIYYDIIHTDGKPKGNFIKNNLVGKKYNKLMFIDDLDENIKNVLDTIENIEVHKINIY